MNGTWRPEAETLKAASDRDLTILKKYEVRYVIFRRESPLVYFLGNASGWKIDYQDATTAVLERADETGPARAQNPWNPASTGYPRPSTLIPR